MCLATAVMAVTGNTAAGPMSTRIPRPKTMTIRQALQGDLVIITIDFLMGSSGGVGMLNIKIVTWSLAIWTTFSFVFCVVFALLTPSTLYMHALLLQILPGFEWFSWRGFLVGLIESFLYGAYAGLVYVPIYNFLHRKWATR